MAALINGLTTAPPAGLAALGVGGKSFTIADLITQLKAYLALLQAVVSAEAALAAAHDALDAEAADLLLFVQQASSSIKGALGKKSSSLTTYGLAPERTPAPLTVAQAQVKVEKMLAIREARGTKGKRQLAAIHGVVPTPTTTATAPATAAATAAATKTGS